MIRWALMACAAAVASSGVARAQAPTRAQQIAAAVLPLPASLRDGAR